jgi:phosphatidylglycerol:prolipoprotein diacylglycerol transferase
MFLTLFHPAYLLSGLFAFGILFLFPITKNIDPSQKRKYYILQVVTLLGAVVGAKLSVLFGDYNWPATPLQNWHSILVSGRSITGALILGFLGAELAKPLLGYTLPPNDRFAAIVPFSIGIGRIGCFFTGCCGGLPYTGFCAVRNAEGILSHPTQLYEMVFQFTIGAIFLFCVQRRIFYGRLFSIYLMAYGGFRFLTEPLRATPKYASGYSGYQLLAAVMIFLGLVYFLKSSFRGLRKQTTNLNPPLNPNTATNLS